MVSEEFILKAKIALQIQKTRIGIATRLYSHLTETFIRGHKKYNELLLMRKNKDVDRKKTAAFTKKVLLSALKSNGLSIEDFNKLFAETKQNNSIYVSMEKIEEQAFKEMKPLLEEIPLWSWIKSVKGLGLNFGVKLLCHLRDVKRFPNPSKLRKYCGITPGSKLIRDKEAHFNPELKGILLGQIAKSFLMAKSQFCIVYNKKKVNYANKYSKELEVTEQKKEKNQKITKEDWTKIRIHNYAIKAMINRFLVELWLAAWKVEGKEPPTSIYILNDPKHHKGPMIVPVEQSMIVSEEKEEKDEEDSE